jgi:hypothetical protein
MTGEVKILAPTGLDLRSLGLQPVSSRYTDCAVPAFVCVCISAGLPEGRKDGREVGQKEGKTQREERYGAG